MHAHRPLRSCVACESSGDGNPRGIVPPFPWAGRGIALGQVVHRACGRLGGRTFLMERAMVAAWSNSDREVVPATTPDDASIHERPTLPEALPRDTIVDPPRSFFVRASAWLASIGRAVAMARRRPRLADHLPPVPAQCTGEITHDSVSIGDANTRPERMLLDIMRAPPDYLDAAILIARATRALHKRGNDVFAEGFVAFALSRMLPDADGTIPIKRLREHVRDIPSAKGIVPVLLRLEEQGVVSLEAPHDQATSSGMVDVDRVRVRLVVVP
jgi:hypothetical protein